MVKEIRRIAFSFNEKYVSQALTEIKGNTEELRTAGIKYIGGAAHGFQLAEFEVERTEFLKRLKNAGFVFIRHQCLYDYEIELGSETGSYMVAESEDGLKVEGTDLESLVELLLKQMEAAPEKRSFSIQARAYEQKEKEMIDRVRVALEECIKEKGYVLDVKHPEQIISLFLRDQLLLAGFGNEEENRSRWSGGMAHYKQETWEVSRSMYKLMEAMEVFHIKPTAGETALDLGAAPGGWTSVLLRTGMKVISVDTGELDENLRKERAIEYRQINASELDLGERRVDFIVSDMSWNPVQAAKLVCRAAQWLKSGGEAVVTVKLLNGKPVKSLNEARKIYEEVFQILDGRQLFHNREEVTLYLKKR